MRLKPFHDRLARAEEQTRHLPATSEERRRRAWSDRLVAAMVDPEIRSLVMAATRAQFARDGDKSKLSNLFKQINQKMNELHPQPQQKG